jgi:putative peptide zinc metalloprotease protein
MAWPQLREELDVFPGPAGPDGHPSWVLHDPVRQHYFQIDWLTWEVLSRWDMGHAEAIVHAVQRDTPLHIDATTIEQVLSFLSRHELLLPTDAKAAGEMAQKVARSQQRLWTWLIHHYLFFRIPLLKPDAWLTRWAPVAEVFFSHRFLKLTGLALLIGGYQVMQQWSLFKSTLVDTFTWQGLVSYGAALFVVKLLHELGHAFAAKRHGCRVPRMGLAFLVMWPMAYTDTNEAWRLPSRRARLQIASAGIVTELMIACWATLAWALLPEGGLKSSAFFLATLSWVATLAINASPFMRFDGYFIVMDLLNLPNLHARSFALGRWQLREWLFDLQEAPPERMSAARQRALVAFAFAVWIYRLVLFIGIALMVYHLFTKLLGVLLFGIEIYWFVLYPIRSEIQAWLLRTQAIRKSQRARWSAMTVAAGVMMTLLPLPSWITAHAILRPGQSWPIYAPGPARVDALPWTDGAAIAPGQGLLQLTEPELLAQAHVVDAKNSRLSWQAATTSLHTETQQPLKLAREQFQISQADTRRIQEQMAPYAPSAPFAGVFRWAQPDLAVGMWVARHELLGTLVGPDPWKVETWLDEDQIQRLSIGDNARFLAPGLAQPLRLKIISIDADATRQLVDGQLAAPLGGHILSREQGGKWYPEQAVYRVVLEIHPVDAQHMPPKLSVQRGHLSLTGQAESLLGRYVRKALSVLLREFQP